MSLSEMWCSFCNAKRNFLPSYITYHYFRSKGWVPKIGIKYATDFGKIIDQKHFLYTHCACLNNILKAVV